MTSLNIYLLVFSFNVPICFLSWTVNGYRRNTLEEYKIKQWTREFNMPRDFATAFNISVENEFKFFACYMFKPYFSTYYILNMSNTYHGSMGYNILPGVINNSDCV